MSVLESTINLTHVRGGRKALLQKIPNRKAQRDQEGQTSYGKVAEQLVVGDHISTKIIAAVLHAMNSHSCCFKDRDKGHNHMQTAAIFKATLVHQSSDEWHSQSAISLWSNVVKLQLHAICLW